MPATTDPYIQQLIQTHRIDPSDPLRDSAWPAIAAEADQAAKRSTQLAAWSTGGRPGDPYSRALAQTHRIDTPATPAAPPDGHGSPPTPSSTA